MPEATLRALLPAWCAVAGADPLRLHPLLPGEDGAGMVPARLAEFSAGRHAARLALASLGLRHAAIPQGADRAPVWPGGVTGSISHGAGVCLAAVAPADRADGIGVDVEADMPLPADLWEVVLRPEERATLAVLPTGMAGTRAMAAFSAKEAAFKAQYPASRALFDFHTLTLTAEAGGFRALFTRPVAPFAAGAALRVRQAVVQGRILSAAVLPKSRAGGGVVDDLAPW